MKLSKIELRNFRCFEEAFFQFHPKFTVLIGENGKGKTTVLDAIAIALGTYFQGSGIKAGQSGIRKTDARFVLREKGDESYREPSDRKIPFIHCPSPELKSVQVVQSSLFR